MHDGTLLNAIITEVYVKSYGKETPTVWVYQSADDNMDKIVTENFHWARWDQIPLLGLQGGERVFSKNHSLWSGQSEYTKLGRKMVIMKTHHGKYSILQAKKWHKRDRAASFNMTKKDFLTSQCSDSL